MRMQARWWTLGIVVAFTLSAAWAQDQAAPQGGQTPPPSTPPSTGPGPGTGTGQQPSGGRSRSPFEEQNRTDRFERPVFLSGRVMLDDGTPPPEPVTIERVCHGQVRPEGYTDSRGRFSFQLGQQNNTMMDASVGGLAAAGPPGSTRDTFAAGPGGFQAPSGGMGMVDLSNCELRASLPGYRSEPVMLGRRSVFDNPDVGTIVLRRLGNVQGTAISFTTLAAPRDAKRSYEKAQNTLRQKNPKRLEAVKELEKAVQLYPQYAAAWTMLGETKLALQDEEGARTAFERAAESDPKYINPQLQLALLDLQAARWEPASEITQRLVSLNPYLIQAQYFNALAHFNLGKMEVAEKSARHAAESEDARRLPHVHRLFGAILAKKGDFPSAAEQYRLFLTLSPNGPEAGQLRRTLTEWEGLGVIPRAAAASEKDKENP
jgi:Tfp pilus assembly protein PilF